MSKRRTGAIPVKKISCLLCALLLLFPGGCGPQAEQTPPESGTKAAETRTAPESGSNAREPQMPPENKTEEQGTQPPQTESAKEEETVTKDEHGSAAEAIRPRATLVIEANGRTFYADLEDNPSAEAFKEKLNSGPLTLELHDYGSFEKVGPLPWTLPRSDVSITTVPGDVILYLGNQLTIYYDTNSWTFTRLARIRNVTKDRLLEAFGSGSVSVTLWLEWSE